METSDAPPKQQEADESIQGFVNLDISTSSQLIASNKNATNVAYRVTGIPIDYKQKKVKALLQTVLQLDKAGNSVKLRSIAISPNRKTKVATVCFSCRPTLLPPRAGGEWHFPIPEDNTGNSSADDDDDIIPQEQIITVDSHFKGITVLRSFSKLEEHKIDIIAISGLGGHAFGSFKARDGQHMWLCDSLPRDLPGAQIMIYGYDTQLHGSKSFQDLESLASSLRASIAAQRTFGSTNAKSRAVPLVFIAHSLGGLIVKEAIIQMEKDKKHQDLLESIYGGLFFGVPSLGMEIASLIPMVKCQPNQALLHTLGKESQLLRNQSRDFPKAFASKESEIFCYYETEMSRTAILTENNGWKMDGPFCILVDSSSASHTRSWENEAHNCIGMKRDHSALVKFSPNDSDYDEVLAKLNRMTLTAVSTIPRSIRGQQKLKQLTEKEKKAIEESLKFERMEARFFDVETASTATCDWLFSTREYNRWLDRKLVSKHHGFLWIKGKPGSGKSTIMKHAVEVCTNAAPLSTIVTFFFNARGTELERSILGMYRSVLLQLVTKISTILDDFLHLFSSKIKHGEVYEWNIGELQAILIAIMKKPQEYPVMWFIDALDECKDDEALKLVKFFKNIGRTAVSSRSPLHICLSTRHYPNIATRRDIQLVLEDQDGHNQDIKTYIDSELFIEPHGIYVDRIKDELRSRSLGVFIWVVLVVELLNTAISHGEDRPTQLQQLLDNVPEKLDDLFTNILKADPSSKDKSILCFQWLLFSKEPLRPDELYFAVLAGIEPTSIGERDVAEIDFKGVENFILHISKGLVEVSKKNRTVQFIHESIRDFFLLYDGFAKLEPNFATNVRGFSEERLKHCCYQYLVQGVFKDSHWNPASVMDDIFLHFPFAGYAVQHIFTHAEAAQSLDIDQREFLTNIEAHNRTPIQKWMMLHNDLHYFRNDRRLMYNDKDSPIYDDNDSLIYILTGQNLPDLLLILIQSKENLNAKGEYHGSPLQLAAKKGHITIAQRLIAAGADIEFPGNEYEPTALFSAISTRHPDIAYALLANGARYDIVNDGSETPLIFAARYGCITVVQKLLELGADVNFEHEGDGNALDAAALNGHYQIVQLLLQSKANTDGKCGSLLQVAARDGNEKMAQLLLDAGANVNITGGIYGSVLQAAARDGNEKMVQLLLDAGANVNITSGIYGSVLQVAARDGNENMAQLLLDAGANVNITGGIYGSALQAAARDGNEKMVQLLLDAGANVNITDGRYGSALRAAAFFGNEKALQVLLDAGAHANSKGTEYSTALYMAATQGNEKMVQLLLDARVNVNIADRRFGGALEGAARGGNEKVVQLLLNAGADVNCIRRRSGSALQVAAKNGNEQVVRLLLSAGADVDCMGGDSSSALEEAVKNGHTDISQLLRLHGAKEVEA